MASILSSKIEKQVLIIGIVFVLLGLIILGLFNTVFSKYKTNEYIVIDEYILPLDGSKLELKSSDYFSFKIELEGYFESKDKKIIYDPYNKIVSDKKEEFSLLKSNPKIDNFELKDIENHKYVLLSFENVELSLDTTLLSTELNVQKNELKSSLEGNISVTYKGSHIKGFFGAFVSISDYISIFLIFIGFIFASGAIYISILKKNVIKKKKDLGIDFDEDLEESLFSISSKYDTINKALKKKKIASKDEISLTVKKLCDSSFVFIKLIQQYRNSIKDIKIDRIIEDSNRFSEYLPKIQSESLKQEIEKHIDEKERFLKLYETAKSNNSKYNLKLKTIISILETVITNIKSSDKDTINKEQLDELKAMVEQLLTDDI